MKKPMTCFLVVAVFLLAWNPKQLATGFPHPSERYFRFFGTGSGDGDDNDDDEPRDEEISPPIPDFLPHFHTIGFPEISSDPYVEKDYLNKSFDLVVKNSDKTNKEVIPNDDDDDIDDDPNICLVCESNSGAQLWGALCPSLSLFSGLIPHFKGKSRNQLCIMTTLGSKSWDPEKNKLVTHQFGTVLCTFDYNGDVFKFLQNYEEGKQIRGITIMDTVARLPGTGVVHRGMGFAIPETREGYIVFCFHCHNLAFKEDSSNTPLIAVAQLSGFANAEVECFDSFQDFETWSMEVNRHCNKSIAVELSRKGIDIDDIRFSSQCFVTDTKKIPTDNKHALIIGHVVETEIKTNENTGERFVWALIRTAKDMEIDVVFRQSLLEERGSPLPKVGGVVMGHFWLSGLLMIDEEGGYL